MAQRLGPLLVIAILFAPLGASGGTPTDPELRGELLRLKDADQAVRDLPLTTDGEERVLSAVDAVRTARLKALLRPMAGRPWRRWARTGRTRLGCWPSMPTRTRRSSAQLRKPWSPW